MMELPHDELLGYVMDCEVPSLHAINHEGGFSWIAANTRKNPLHSHNILPIQKTRIKKSQVAS